MILFHVFHKMKLFLLFAFILQIISVQGVNIYIRPNGTTKSNCSTVSTGCTLEYGVSRARSGDILFLNGDFTIGLWIFFFYPFSVLFFFLPHLNSGSFSYCDFPDHFNNGDGINITKAVTILTNNLNARFSFPRYARKKITIFRISSFVTFRDINFTQVPSPHKKSQAASVSSTTNSNLVRKQRLHSSHQPEKNSESRSSTSHGLQDSQNSRLLSVSAISVVGENVRISMENCKFHGIKYDSSLVQADMILHSDAASSLGQIHFRKLVFENNENVSLIQVKTAPKTLNGYFSFQMDESTFENNRNPDHDEVCYSFGFNVCGVCTIVVPRRRIGRCDGA